MSPPANKLMRNYGWVQNTSNLSTIRDTVDLVPEHGIRHLELRERIREFRQANNDLPNRWTWDARCRIKAIHALGFVNLNRNIQGYELTELGERLKNCPISNEFIRGTRLPSEEELAVFKDALLTNPPVIRVLQLLSDERRTTNIGLTKYEVGSQLGFIGDPGFTHLDPVWVVTNGYGFNDKEGDADKWARTILSWLRQVGWAEPSGHANIGGKNLRRFKATEAVDNVLRYNVSRIERNVASEMLCSDKHSFPKYIQKRRSVILEYLSSKAQRRKEARVDELIDALNANGIDTDPQQVHFEVISLRQAGFRIDQEGSLLRLNDKLNLEIDPLLFDENMEETEDDISYLIEELVVRYEDTIPPQLVDSLVRYGNDGAEGVSFESSVARYFRFLGYTTDYLGQGRGRTADVIAKYQSQTYARSYGLIIDAKATSASYSFPAADIRKMKEYIETHGRELLSEAIPNHAFVFISSAFCTDVSTPLNEISQETGVSGSAMEVLGLLELGALIRAGSLQIENLYPTFITNLLYETPAG